MRRYDRVLTIRREIFGDDSAKVADTLHNSGNVHSKEKRYADALQM